jgi:hypothetical protein
LTRLENEFWIRPARRALANVIHRGGLVYLLRSAQKSAKLNDFTDEDKALSSIS